jgi:hypothetical protein
MVFRGNEIFFVYADEARGMGTLAERTGRFFGGHEIVSLRRDCVMVAEAGLKG